MQVLKLVHNMVKLGEPVPWGVLDAQGGLLLAQGSVIATAGQLTVLLQRGAFVDAEEAKAAALRAAEIERQRQQQQQEQQQQRQRPANLFVLWDRLLWQLERLLKSIEEPGFLQRMDELLQHLVTLTERDPDVAIYLCVRQDPKRLSIYGLAHAIHCALICLLVARRIGWEESKVLATVKAALTMNISTIELQGRLAVQGAPPTAAQKEQLAVHPSRSVEMLRAAGVDEAPWLTAVAQHHEKADGSGYPNKLKEPEDVGRLLRSVDVFMAKISPRAARAPLSTQVAARQLFQEDQSPLSAAIVKEVGIFPPGELVQLKSGEQAVVLRRTAKASMPMVAALINRNGMPVATTVMRDTSKPEFAIVSTIAEKGSLALRMQPERLYGLPE